MCLFSWASMGMPTLSPTMATFCLTLTCDLWYGERFYYPGSTMKLHQSYCLNSIKKGRNWSPNPTTTALTCQRWNGKTQRRKWVWSSWDLKGNARGDVSVWCLCCSWGQPWFKDRQEPCLSMWDLPWTKEWVKITPLTSPVGFCIKAKHSFSVFCRGEWCFLGMITFTQLLMKHHSGLCLKSKYLEHLMCHIS